MKRFLFLVLALFPVSAFSFDLRHDGKLKLYHSHSDETLAITYEMNGTLLPEAMQRINHFMRSRAEDAVREMDPNLIRLLDHIQDHFKADTVEVICGYRSPAFNKSLKDSGRNVAENSAHMTGIAADIHLDEISEDKLAKYIWGLGKGGVGYYADLLMVHVDLGQKRFWQENRFTDRRNIGIFTEAPVELKTDHLFYEHGKRMRLSLSKSPSYRLGGSLVLEHFHSGKFGQVGEVPMTAFPKPNTLTQGEAVFNLTSSKSGRFEAKGPELALPYGKFRWKVLSHDGSVQHSNEFYLKRK